MFVHPNGIGASTGDSLVVSTAPLYMSGNVWFVDSATGNNLNNGRERRKPLATLLEAVNSASSGDIIVLLSTHAESITATVTIAKRVVIVGEGSSSGIPTASLTRGFDGTMLSFSAGGEGAQIRNVNFPASTVASAAARIVTIGSQHFIGCYLQSGANDTGAAISIGTNDVRLESCTIISTSTTTAPAAAILLSGAISRLYIKNCIFDGGTIGFASFGYALNSNTNVITGLYAEGITLRNGADVDFATTTVGFAGGLSGTIDGRVIW